MRVSVSFEQAKELQAALEPDWIRFHGRALTRNVGTLQKGDQLSTSMIASVICYHWAGSHLNDSNLHVCYHWIDAHAFQGFGVWGPAGHAGPSAPKPSGRPLPRGRRDGLY